MIKPNSVNELATLLDSLAHRERVVFPVSESVKQQLNNDDVYAVEVYHTVLWNSKHQDRNINIKLVDILGKPIEENGKALVNKSKYLRLFTPSYLQNVYNILGGDFSAERKALANKPLAIC